MTFVLHVIDDAASILGPFRSEAAMNEAMLKIRLTHFKARDRHRFFELTCPSGAAPAIGRVFDESYFRAIPEDGPYNL